MPSCNRSSSAKDRGSCSPLSSCFNKPIAPPACASSTGYLGPCWGLYLVWPWPTCCLRSGQILLLLGSIYLFYYWINQNYTIAVIYYHPTCWPRSTCSRNQGIAVMLLPHYRDGDWRGAGLPAGAIRVAGYNTNSCPPSC